jgi:hypothetical protein
VQELAAITISTNPLVLNTSLSATNTLLQGTVTDTSGNPIADAVILITDAIGETPVMLTTDADGLWETGQLAAGNYTITMQALGYLPPSQGTISLTPGTPQTVNLSFTPVASDDDASSQFFYTLPQGIAQALQTYPCNQPPDESTFQLNVTPADCPCAYQSSFPARQTLDRAQQQMNVAWETWNQAYSDGQANTGANIAISTEWRLVKPTAFHGFFVAAAMGNLLEDVARFIE